MLAVAGTIAAIFVALAIPFCIGLGLAVAHERQRRSEAARARAYARRYTRREFGGYPLP